MLDSQINTKQLLSKNTLNPVPVEHLRKGICIEFIPLTIHFVGGFSLAPVFRQDLWGTVGES
jgi:hypothetical protein